MNLPQAAARASCLWICYLSADSRT